MIRIGRIYYENGRMYVKGADGKLHEFGFEQWQDAQRRKGDRRW